MPDRIERIWSSAPKYARRLICSASAKRIASAAGAAKREERAGAALDGESREEQPDQSEHRLVEEAPVGERGLDVEDSERGEERHEGEGEEHGRRAPDFGVRQSAKEADEGDREEGEPADSEREPDARLRFERVHRPEAVEEAPRQALEDPELARIVRGGEHPVRSDPDAEDDAAGDQHGEREERPEGGDEQRAANALARVGRGARQTRARP